MDSSDDGISLLLAMVPNLCIDKKLGFDSPRCAVSFPEDGIGQMDSKQEFFEPMFREFGGDMIEVLHGGQNDKYLGKKLSGDLRNRAMVDLQHRSQIAWMKFKEHRDTLLHWHVSLRLRLNLFDSVITPTISFGLFTCPLTSNQLQKQEVLRNRMRRSIVGWAPLVDNDWHALMQKNRTLQYAQHIFNVRPWTERLLVGTFRFAAKIASAMNSWASITSDWFPYHGWQMN